MSLTQNAEIFLGLRESALNNALKAFFLQRPRFLSYSSAIPMSTLLQTHVGQLLGQNWTALLSGPPVADLFPAATGWAGPNITSDHFGLKFTNVHFSLLPFLTFSVDVTMLGHPTLTGSTAGPAIGLIIDQVRFSNSSVSGLDTALNAIAPMFPPLLQPLLGQVTLPLPTLGIGPVSPAGGPWVQANEIDLLGNL
jgi:hypothetical protein